jgi:hypothetical protein
VEGQKTRESAMGAICGAARSRETLSLFLTLSTTPRISHIEMVEEILTVLLFACLTAMVEGFASSFSAHVRSGEGHPSFPHTLA